MAASLAAADANAVQARPKPIRFWTGGEVGADCVTGQLTYLARLHAVSRTAMTRNLTNTVLSLMDVSSPGHPFALSSQPAAHDVTIARFRSKRLTPG